MGRQEKNGKNKMKKILSFFSIVLIFAITLMSCKKDEVNNNDNGGSGGGGGTHDVLHSMRREFCSSCSRLMIARKSD